MSMRQALESPDAMEADADERARHYLQVANDITVTEYAYKQIAGVYRLIRLELERAAKRLKAAESELANAKYAHWRMTSAAATVHSKLDESALQCDEPQHIEEPPREGRPPTFKEWSETSGDK